MINVLNKFNLVCKNSEYPIYAPFLHSEGGILYANNGTSFLKVNCKTEFEGNINFFNLYPAIKNLSYYTIEQKKNKLHITSDNFQTDLKMLNRLEVPNILLPDIPFYTLSEDIIQYIKYAFNFTSPSGDNEYVYVSHNYIYGLSNNRLFLANLDTGINTRFFISKDVLPFLIKDCQINIENNNIFIKYSDLDGYSSIKVPQIYESKLDTIKDYIQRTENGAFFLCDVSFIKDAISKVDHIFLNEKEKNISFENKDNKLIIYANSNINGVASYEIESGIGEEFKLEIDSTLFNFVPLSYKVYVNLNNLDRVLLKDNNNKITFLSKGY